MFLTANRVTTIGAYLLMLGWLTFLYDMIYSLRHGKKAPANPWHAKTLEWMVPTPVPLENFTVEPVVTSDFYGWGEPAVEPAEGPEREPELVPAGSTSPTDVGG
jgi:cytochrome c oxidase subunit 1